MLRPLLPPVALTALLSACGPVPPMDPVRAAALCDEQARAAQGPTGSVTIGTSSDEGPYLNTEIGISSDFITGRDPQQVYEECVIARTGALPIRPPRLRR